MDIKTLNIIVAIAYIIIMATGAIAISYIMLEKQKARRSLRESIQKKMSQKISLSASDIIIMAKGVRLQRPSVARVVYRLLHDCSDPEMYERLKTLSVQLDKEEPFDDLPEEVKPSLIRLSELCHNSQQKSDQFLLAPIQKNLGSYVEMKTEFERSKKQTKLINFLGVISFIIGIWGFYLALKSPNTNDIANAVFEKLGTQSNASRPLPGKDPSRNVQ